MGNTNQQPAKDEGRSRGGGQRKELDPKESHGLVNKITGRQRRREVASIDFKPNTLFPWRNKGSAALRNEQRKVSTANKNVETIFVRRPVQHIPTLCSTNYQE